MVIMCCPSLYCVVFNYHCVMFVQVTGKCGSVLVRLIPAPRGTSIVAAGVPKKLLQMAGVSDCYTSARGQTATLGNFGKLTVQGVKGVEEISPFCGTHSITTF